MKKILAVIGLAVAGLVGLSAVPASAAGQLCHDVTVVVNGESVVDDASCTALP